VLSVKKILSLFSITFFILAALSINAKEYVLVGISGFGTRDSNDVFWQPSGAHENLPYGSYKRFELVHYSKKAALQNVIDVFQCHLKKESRPDLGLIVIANSWGSRKALKLSEMFNRQCKDRTELFIMVDGYKKPFLPQNKKPVAKKCLNYYQTKGVVRGMSIKGCQNYDLTKKMCPPHVKGIECHINIEWEGTKRAKEMIEKDYL